MIVIPETTEYAVWFSKYQRRTLTGIGWKKKTVLSRTGKTPRTIVITFCATTSASIMVRFFCILIGYAFNSMNLSPQRKTLFYNIGDFSCKILANSPINCLSGIQSHLIIKQQDKQKVHLTTNAGRH
jgi:hypothetical protein